MKICPSCQRTYADETLNFCLDDGTVLNRITNTGEKTVVMDSVPTTAAVNPPPTIQSSYDNRPNQNFSMQPQAKKSRPWLWVIGIIGGIFVLCMGTFGLLALIGAMNEKGNSNRRVVNTSDPNPGPTVRNSPTTDNDPTKTVVDMTKWGIGNTAYGTTEINSDSIVLSSKGAGYYYVRLAGPQFRTVGKSTSVTLNNLQSEASQLGYGLVVHSSAAPLNNDYAFLIDTVKKRYRIVRHKTSKEEVVKAWTNSDEIVSGGGENKLMVSESNGQMQFFINQKMITLLQGDPFKIGVAGVYAGDGVRVEFKDLTISK